MEFRVKTNFRKAKRRYIIKRLCLRIWYRIKYFTIQLYDNKKKHNFYWVPTFSADGQLHLAWHCVLLFLQLIRLKSVLTYWFKAVKTFNNIILDRYSKAIFFLMFHQLRKKCEGLLLIIYNISLTNYQNHNIVPRYVVIFLVIIEKSFYQLYLFTIM